MAAKVFDKNNKELKINNAIVIDSKIYYLFFGKYLDKDNKTYIGYYLKHTYEDGIVLDEECIDIFNKHVLNVSPEGSIFTDLSLFKAISFDPVEVDIMKHMEANKDKFSIFLKDEKLKNEVIKGFKEYMKNYKNRSFEYYLEEHAGYLYCPHCKKYKNSRVERTNENRHEFTLNYDEICSDCYRLNRY